MKRLYTSFLGFVFIISMILAGCSNSSGTETTSSDSGADSNSEDVITLSFMGWEASPLETESVKKGLEQFMAENPGIKVKYTPVPGEQYSSKLLTMMAGNSAPDVFFVYADQYRDLVNREALLELTPKLDEEVALEDFIPSSQSIMDVDGKVYGISSTTVSPVLFYNKKIFDEAGIEYPSSNPAESWTWEEFVDVAEKLTIKEGKDIKQYGAYGLEILGSTTAFLRNNGADFFNEDGSIALNNSEAKEGLEAIRKLREDGITPAAQTLENSGMSAPQMLQTGKIGMMIEGSWALQQLATMGFPVGVAPLPKFGSEPSTHGSAHLHSASANTKHPEEAWKLIKFLSSRDYQNQLIKEGLWMPNRVDMYSEEGVKAWHDPKVHPEGFLELNSFFKDAEAYPFVTIQKYVVQDIVSEEFEKYYNGDQNVDDTLSNIDTRVAEELARK